MLNHHLIPVDKIFFYFKLSGQECSYKVDIYSLGIILFELIVSFSTEMERIEVEINITLYFN